MNSEQPSIQPSSEVRAFHCPVCNVLIEIGGNSPNYFTIHGSLKRGEQKQVIVSGGNPPQNLVPCRICVKCLQKLIGDNEVSSISR